MKERGIRKVDTTGLKKLKRSRSVVHGFLNKLKADIDCLRDIVASKPNMKKEAKEVTTAALHDK